MEIDSTAWTDDFKVGDVIDVSNAPNKDDDGLWIVTGIKPNRLIVERCKPHQGKPEKFHHKLNNKFNKGRR